MFDLESILLHPAWILAHSGSLNCSPVTEFHYYEYSEMSSYKVDSLCSREVLSGMPVMSSITSLHFYLEDGNGPFQTMFGRPEQILHHSPGLSGPQEHVLVQCAAPGLGPDTAV